MSRRQGYNVALSALQNCNALLLTAIRFGDLHDSHPSGGLRTAVHESGAERAPCTESCIPRELIQQRSKGPRGQSEARSRRDTQTSAISGRIFARGGLVCNAILKWCCAEDCALRHPWLTSCNRLSFRNSSSASTAGASALWRSYFAFRKLKCCGDWEYSCGRSAYPCALTTALPLRMTHVKLGFCSGNANCFRATRLFFG